MPDVTPDRPGTLPRPTVRIVLVDPAERLLLICAEALDGGAPVWFVVGGGIEPGESLHRAARREVAEETGLSRVRLGPVLWTRRAVLTLAGVRTELREQYLLARVDAFEPDGAGMTMQERNTIREIRWWSAAELADTRERVVPAGLARAFESLLRDGPPTTPLPLT